MTTVNMDEPLPAYITPNVEHRKGAIKTLFVARSVYASYTADDPVTLAHLAQVVAALTGEQLAAVWREMLIANDGAGLLSGASSALLRFHRERADEEKTRADRAEAIIGSLREKVVDVFKRIDRAGDDDSVSGPEFEMVVIQEVDALRPEALGLETKDG